MLVPLLILLQVPDFTGPVRDFLDEEEKVKVPVVTPSSTRVPLGFTGDRPFALVTNYTKSHPAKDKFETSQEFLARVDKADRGPVIGNLTLNDYLAFCPADLKTHDYDADTETASISFDDGIEFSNNDDLIQQNKQPIMVDEFAFDSDKYTATDDEGQDYTVTKVSAVRVALVCPQLPTLLAKDDGSITRAGLGVPATTISFKMPRAAAQQSLEKLQLLLVGKVSNIATGPIAVDIFDQKPTTALPFEPHFFNFQLSFRPEVLWVYNPDTGAILYSIPFVKPS